MVAFSPGWSTVEGADHFNPSRQDTPLRSAPDIQQLYY
jgi:hypothetical protein